MYLYGHTAVETAIPGDQRKIIKREENSPGTNLRSIPSGILNTIKKFFCSNESFYLYLERKKKRCSLPSPSMVFPDEVKLCKSSVPGAEFGVCAAQPIPPGTWIGPYEGQVVRCDELREGVHNIYMWEV